MWPQRPESKIVSLFSFTQMASLFGQEPEDIYATGINFINNSSRDDLIS